VTGSASERGGFSRDDDTCMYIEEGDGRKEKEWKCKLERTWVLDPADQVQDGRRDGDGLRSG
jgi:hypothetical protein